MSGCDVCLSGYDGHAEFFYERAYTARKPHTCLECGSVIQIGEKYLRVGGKCEGDMWEVVVCRFCHEINNVFSCNNGTVWGNFWEEMYDYVFPDLKVTSPCFAKLSFEARQFLTKRWWNWMESQRI